MAEHRTAVAILNFGGPQKEEEVEPFLYELFVDPEVIKLPLGDLLQARFAKIISGRRGPEAGEQYAHIGFSPLVPTSLAQVAALKTALDADAARSAPRIFVGMRYTSPTIPQMVESMKADPPTRIIALALYPHFSMTTTGSSFNLMAESLVDAGLGHIPVHYVPAFYEHPSYLAAMVDLIESTIGEQEDVHLLFSAHGLPSSYYRDGDPYPDQIHDSVRLITSAMPKSRPFSLCFQSKVGPVRWLKPSTEEELARLAAEGTKRVAVVPISFTTEGIETLYEIDITFGDFAKERGLEMLRVPTVDTHPKFIACLADLVQKASDDTRFAGLGGHRCVRCLLPKPHTHRTKAKCGDCFFKTPSYLLRLPPVQ